MLRKEVLVGIVCVVAFLLGLPNIFQGGIYFFKIIDKFSSGVSLMLVAFFEVIAITWFYGGKRLARNVKSMTGSGPGVGFVICWYVVSPLLIVAIMVFNWIDYNPISYGSYRYPFWGDLLGWFLAGLSLVSIPIGMVKGVCDMQGDSLYKKFLASFRAQDHLLQEDDLTEKSKAVAQELTKI